FMIVIASQVQQSVNDVADKFALPGRVEAAGLDDGFVDADEEVPEKAAFAAGQRILRSVIQCDHVGAAVVSEEALVQPGHFRGADQVHADFAFEAGGSFEQPENDPAQEREMDRRLTMAIAAWE